MDENKSDKAEMGAEKNSEDPSQVPTETLKAEELEAIMKKLNTVEEPEPEEAEAPANDHDGDEDAEPSDD